MSTEPRTLLTYIAAIGIISVAVLVLTSEQPSRDVAGEISDTAQIAGVVSKYEPALQESSIPEKQEVVSTADVQSPQEEPSAEISAASAASLPSSAAQNTTASVVRIQNPYPTPPLSFLTVNENTRLALVNILCIPEAGTLQPTSGSGAIIDSRGVILTNAHVAQYVLLAESGQTNLSCVIRSGAPARPLWSANVLYIPPVWIQNHAADITNESPTGTGEHDYALLQIVPLPEAKQFPAPPAGGFPALPIDIREGVGFPGDPVLAASYPAEFVGPRATQFNLHPASTITSVKRLMTFDADTVDMLSLGGVPEAQSGSSGGPIVNAWGHLIGIITTTSEGVTTADRELRALTLSYIDRDLQEQTGLDIAAFLANDIAALEANFRMKHVDTLTELLISEIAKRQYR